MGSNSLETPPLEEVRAVAKALPRSPSELMGPVDDVAEMPLIPMLRAIAELGVLSGQPPEVAVPASLADHGFGAVHSRPGGQVGIEELAQIG